MVRQSQDVVKLHRSLGQALASYRKASSVTQSDLARATNYDRTSIAHIEAGRQSPPERVFWETVDASVGACGALVDQYDAVCDLELSLKQAELRRTQATHRARADNLSLETVRSSHNITSPSDSDISGVVAVAQIREQIQVLEQEHALLAETGQCLGRVAFAGNSSSPSSVAASDGVGVGDRVRRSQREWLEVRRASGARGRELNELAAWLYPKSLRAPGGHVLAPPGWLLDAPVELDEVRLVWSGAQPPPPRLVAVEHVLPLSDRGERYRSYSRAVRDLVRPRLMENRLSYRLLAVAPGPTLTCGVTNFFESFDAQQLLAHEFKAAWREAGGSIPGWHALPLRAAVGEWFDPARMVMSPGISTLTIRRDRGGEHRFVLHERDGAAVADGGGLCSVMPAGEFQPSSVHPADLRNDLSPWRNIMREFSEEFLGNPEHDGGSTRPIDYTEDEPFRSFERARAAGRLRLWHYGLWVDPLTLGPGQQTVAVIDDEVFDRLFAGLVATNDEGRVVGMGGRADIPFAADAIDRLDHRLSPGTVTLLRLAWRDRAQLLDD
jgi:transcriptional regulator with XRE-family HTH domain